MAIRFDVALRLHVIAALTFTFDSVLLKNVFIFQICLFELVQLLAGITRSMKEVFIIPSNSDIIPGTHFMYSMFLLSRVHVFLYKHMLLLYK